MKRRRVLRRSAVVGIALASATAIVVAATGGAAMAKPPKPPKSPRGEVRGASVASVAGVVKDRYIVVLKDKKASPSKVRATASALTSANGGSVRNVFTSTVRGFSAQMTAAQAKLLTRHADVAYVEQVHKFSATGTQTNPPSWGLDRIDQTTPVLNKSYTYSATGSGITAYVIDTGIKIDHQDFGGRASYGYDFIDNDAVADDCYGHGTHVAGTVGGTTYGVAKGANLVAVRVLDCEGFGSTEQVLAGIDWVTADVAKPENAGKRAVANMSLGGPADQAIDDAVKKSIEAGVTYALSAGNSNANACQQSPARVPAAITAGATDLWDMRAEFSNFGSCVDVFAPGVDITSASIASTTAAETHSGTSMASPHVAGAAALLLSANPTWTPAQVRDAIVTGGTSGAVQDAKSLNRLLRVGATEAARASVGFRAYANGKYVTAESAGARPLIANRAGVGLWEQFDQVNAGGGFIALKAKANGKYVTAESAGAKPLIASRTAIGSWEKFQVIHNTDGSVSLKANANGKYVTAESAGTKPLIASRTAIGQWEKFDYAAPAPTVSIKAYANGKYVTAESAGTKPLIANRTAAGAWEKFDLVAAGIDPQFGLRWVALKAKVNSKYVTAESAGAKPLIANRTSAGTWEKFFVFQAYKDDGSVDVGKFFLVANANFLVVSAESGGAKPLIANRESFGLWETFGLTAM